VAFGRKEESRNSTELSDRVQSILASKGLTLRSVSRQSEALYGKSSRYFIPHNFYYELCLGSYKPSVHQIFAFSRISGFRFHDWLRVFDFDPEDITRLQIGLPAPRTLLLDTTLADPSRWVRWFHNRPHNPQVPAIAPLRTLLAPAQLVRIESLSTVATRDGFIYIKVGREDAIAFPDLLPGTIVRINPALSENLLTNANMNHRLFLLEHRHGFCCCRIHMVDQRTIVPISNLLSYAQIEFRYPREVRILGLADLAILPLLSQMPAVPKDLAQHRKPLPLASGVKLSTQLREARIRMHLSLRGAAALSRAIAEKRSDPHYYLSASTLCEYEVSEAPARDFRKLVSLCSIYGLKLNELLRAMEIPVEDAGKEPIADRFYPHITGIKRIAERGDSKTLGPGFLEHLIEEFEELPFFLWHSVGLVAGLGHLSLEDFFWIGGERDPLHPYLENGLLALVNRRKKTAVHFRTQPPWQQPLYLLLKRDGTYMAACCGTENGTLVIHPYVHDFHRSAQFRQHQDAEVIGQIVVIARKLL